ncbi:MAG: hypothetical protein IV086_02050 [Hyphomonadaceae bacterium]|nr:MAG: hypothetical protein FD160_1074 [Caulobacteraceae bacterium]MBT9444463.1 hypothetical protein [Hyphomonadaceae bacterium]TPW07108.1 MAG: hypothetical protein FD124_1383 [Alphaproteobacteria bacterium]
MSDAFPVQDQLSDFEHNEVGKKLVEKGYTSLTCEVCGQSNTWVLSRLVVSPVAMQRADIVTKIGGFHFGGSTMPSSPLLCTNCGNTKLINLVVLGIRSPNG